MMQRQMDMRSFLQPEPAAPSVSDRASDAGFQESAADVEEAWGLKEMEVDEKAEATHAKSLLELLQKTHSKYGGLEKFLQVRFQKKYELQSFADYLGELCPCGSGHEFAVAKDLPAISPADMGRAETLRVHPASFAFLDNATVRGPAEADVVTKLAEEILLDGLVTAGEALLLTQSTQLTDEVLKMYGDDDEVGDGQTARSSNPSILGSNSCCDSNSRQLL